MTQGYYAGISGLQTNQYGLDVISDNLSNTDTIGFKSSSTEFADLFSRVMSSDSTTPTSDDIGYGSKLQATSFNFDQGVLMPTERLTDLAIEGNGWFGINMNNDTVFTRDGQFVFDTYKTNPDDENSSIARLATLSGLYPKGTMLNNFTYDAAFDYRGETGAYVINNATTDVPLGDIGSQGIIEFPTLLAYPAKPTSKTSFYGNLGIEDETRTMSAQAISPNGDRNVVQLTFTQSETQPAAGGIAWDITATVTSLYGEPVYDPQTGELVSDGKTIYDTQVGTATFSNTGLIETYSPIVLDNDGAPVSVDLGTSFGRMISSSGISVSASSQSDGIEKGILTKYGINTDGIIIADFSNGKQSAIGRVALYHFQNDQGLNREGGTYYTQSSDSGKPLFWTDPEGNPTNGSIIRSGYVEASNVRTDIGLTDMIITQRAYQANGKVITTVDEMIQKALSMRR